MPISEKNPRAHTGQRELDNLGLLNVQDRVTQLKLSHVSDHFAPVFPTDTITIQAKVLFNS